MKKELAKKLKIQGIIFLGLFILLEVILRMMGMQAGTTVNDFKVEDNPVYQPRFTSDETGVNHILPIKEMLILGSVINKQGFRGDFEYRPETVDSLRKNTNKEILMFIGDSYVEGCCPDSASNSFPDLVNEDSKYTVLNFGVAGTDPLQYALVAKKYIKELKPDRVVIAVYFGNDIMTFERKPSPGTPLTFPFKKNKWIYAVAPNHLSGEVNHVFKTPEEAYQFFVEHYTLKGNNRNWFEKAISYSVVLSKIYLVIEDRLALRKWQKNNPKVALSADDITYANLKEVAIACDSAKVPYLFVGIPSPGEAADGVDLKIKYKGVFKDIPWYVPTDLNKEDYDGTSIANHFNNRGHQKYSEFLKKLLSTTKKK